MKAMPPLNVMSKLSVSGRAQETCGAIATSLCFRPVVEPVTVLGRLKKIRWNRCGGRRIARLAEERHQQAGKKIPADAIAAVEIDDRATADWLARASVAVYRK